jgi:hypothetical protein
MRLRFILPALMIGAGLLLPVQTPAVAKTSYKQHKAKKYKASRKFKAGKKFKGAKVGKHQAPKHQMHQRV